MNAKKLYRLLVILFLAGLLSSVLIVRYTNGWLSESSDDLQKIRAEASTLEEKRTNLEKVQQTLSYQKVAIQTLDKVLPKEKEQARVVKQIYQIADQAGVKIDSIGFPASTLGVTSAGSANNQAVSQATPVKEIPGVQSIELSLGNINSATLPEGSGIRYNELIRFMQLLERNQRIIQIRSLGIGQSKAIDGEDTFNLSLQMSIFIRS